MEEQYLKGHVEWVLIAPKVFLGSIIQQLKMLYNIYQD
jgi:hypothetical protein